MHYDFIREIEKQEQQEDKANLDNLDSLRPVQIWRRGGSGDSLDSGVHGSINDDDASLDGLSDTGTASTRSGLGSFGKTLSQQTKQSRHIGRAKSNFSGS